MDHIQFDNKEYIITPNTFTNDQMAAECATIGPGYKPAYINYKEEYEMWVHAYRLSQLKCYS